MHRTLGDAMGDWDSGGFAVIYGDVLMSVSEITVKPGES